MAALDLGLTTIRKTGDTFNGSQNTIPQGATPEILYDSRSDGGYGTRFKRVLLNIQADQASAGSGVSYEESVDGGVNFSTCASPNAPGTYAGASAYAYFNFQPRAPIWRIRYTGTTTPSFFRWSLMGDMTTPT